ncbi:MAG: GTP-binding protein, partial [Candidatus Heimdallarchaeota archaeon]|nr:GTP-binding protein [Candidatus Heimdallarchaeota archaeon]
LLGDAAVGKTALVQRFVHEKFSKEYLLTIGMEPYAKYTSVDGTELCFSIFDIAGADQFTRLRSMFYKGSRGALITFDLTRPETLKSVETWYNDANNSAPNQEYYLIGNKSDLVEDRKVKRAEAEAVVKKLGFSSYLETSALTGYGVEDAFLSLGRAILKKELDKEKERT